MVETDYSSYAIVRELHHSGQELNAALQLLSGCHEWGQAPRATVGREPLAGQGLGSPPPLGSPHWHPTCRQPRNSIWGE